MAWLPLTSTTVAPARLDMARWASGGIILSSVVSRYQLGLVLHAGSLIAPLMAPMPHGTWESAINAAFSGSTSAAKAAGNFALSRNRSEEHTSELQSRFDLVCRLLLEKKKNRHN